MKKIFKYALSHIGVNEIKIPHVAAIQHVGQQDGVVTMWIEVDTHASLKSRQFIIYGTGHEIDRDHVYIGTAQMPNGLVWHVYEDLDQAL